MTIRNSIRSWALVAVAISSVFIMGMRVWDQILLGHTDWCARALGAAKYATGRPAYAIEQCFELQQMQIKTLSNGSMIDAGTIALCLVVLVVIVLAGGKVSLTTPWGGGNISSDRKDAAKKVAEAAKAKAEEIE